MGLCCLDLQVKNFVRVNQLNQEIVHLRQGEKSLENYFAALRSILEELDRYECCLQREDGEKQNL